MIWFNEIHVGVLLSTEAPENKFQRTVILMEKPTKPGEYVFFRGGIDHSRREGEHRYTEFTQWSGSERVTAK